MCAWLCVWIGCLRCVLGVPADFYTCFFFCYSGVGGLLSTSSPDQPKCCQFPWQFRWATAATALTYLAQTVLKLQAQKESFWMQTGGGWVGTCLCKWIEDECSAVFFYQLCCIIAGGSSGWQRNTTSCLSIWTPRLPVRETTITCCDAKWTSSNSSHPEEAHWSPDPVEYFGFFCFIFYFIWSYVVSVILLLPHLEIKTVCSVSALCFSTSWVNPLTWAGITPSAWNNHPSESSQRSFPLLIQF